MGTINITADDMNQYSKTIQNNFSTVRDVVAHFSQHQGDKFHGHDNRK